ncbi:MAG TPA: aldo/keto reductase [Pseudogracilibacillus sp.]|nr:aldo/keto reductase [Pseudogracilibacillus sp.]
MDKQVQLNNQLMMPRLGFGVYKVPNEDVQEAVSVALESGYRALDTAQFYQNETGVGKAIKQARIAREDLFITTKVWNSHHGYERTMQAFEESLEKLQLDYIDLYLIHWPVPEQDKFIETYRALEDLYKAGTVKAIGVSNFHIHHLERLAKETKIKPVVNQVECHPYLQQQELKDYCKRNEIFLESWSPLYRGGAVLEEQVIQDIAQKHQKTAAQIILRWHVQEDSLIIPKSVTPSRIKENINIFDFELSIEDMKAIQKLDSNTRVGKDPDEMNVTTL